ncbi:MAG: bifunctional diaminohydroxyphosphoribosylaminopyrimidine deaminase/5-amino-6-(5-phosphoribosylamino)uracil reductase RibD [gamma proteobacterium symbiont of Taylorina sp.]|nr:bifunctional diaminohydroxyphosphoribosylaminopyrimidine deaminase/5-amino-6-(5-phosphoribosylamino)uracil reductase RibD [gamma proteobacterium symbiont of Taylorina sp.]
MHSDEYYMAKAIHLAKQGWYTTHPNPRVGCVIVRNDHIIAEGWHQAAGQGHAEVNALAALKTESARGSTAYVTLEPCSHFGKTPPCSHALIAAGVKRVVIAMIDPNPLVAGRGVALLQKNNVEVTNGILESQAKALNPGFIQRMISKRPRVRCKMGMSLDGRTAMANGESQWITSTQAREDVQCLRAESSAILTGIGTVLADDPSMNIRSEKYFNAEHQPDRMILDSYLRMPAAAKMLSLPGKTIILTDERHRPINSSSVVLQTSSSANKTEEEFILDKNCQLSPQKKVRELQQQGAAIEYLKSSDEAGLRQLSLENVVSIMVQQQYNDVLLEAGATLSGAMIQAGYVDELIIYMAPNLMGSEAKGLLVLPGLTHINERIELEIQDIRAVGKDYRITASLNVR